MVTTTMTPTQAVSFDRVSPINASIVQHTLSCGCKPYQDVFTYNRWLAQGYQVMRGEHSIKLGVIKQVEKENDNGEIEIKRLFGNAHVFCRHQVKPITGKTTPVQSPVIAPVIIPPVTETPKPETPKNDNDIMKGWKLI